MNISNQTLLLHLCRSCRWRPSLLFSFQMFKWKTHKKARVSHRGDGVTHSRRDLQECFWKPSPAFHVSFSLKKPCGVIFWVLRYCSDQRTSTSTVQFVQTTRQPKRSPGWPKERGQPWQNFFPALSRSVSELFRQLFWPHGSNFCSDAHCKLRGIFRQSGASKIWSNPFNQFSRFWWACRTVPKVNKRHDR